MRTANLAWMLTALTCCSAFGQTPADKTAERNKILSSIAELSRAYVNRDPAPFERLYLENHVSIRSKPTYNLREQLIAMMQADSVQLRAGKRLEFETIRHESEDPQITFYDRTAVVNVAKRNYWQFGRQKCETRTQATEVWIKPADEWKIAAGHTTTFHCEGRYAYPKHPAVSAILGRTRPPANADFEAEQQVRELIRMLVAARASLEESFETVVQRHIADTFISTDLKGDVGRDRSILTTIQVPLPNRAAGFRTQEDAVLVYGNAAVYTYRLRNTGDPTAADSPQRCTIIFTRNGSRWMIAAAHISKQSTD